MIVWIVIGSLGLIALSVVVSFVLEGLRIYTETDRELQADREGWDHENWEGK